MNPLSDEMLLNLLQTDSSGTLLNGESETLEFKQGFVRDSKESRVKYLKELAAFHNTSGGYLIFGIDDEGVMVGLENFTAPDPAVIAQDIQTYFAPAFRFSDRTIMINNKELYVIYTPVRTSIPTVSTVGYQNILQTSTIYWRYPGVSSPIRYGDLINLLHELKGEHTERRTNIEETRLKLEHKPLLKIEGGMTMSDIAKPKVVNQGKRAHIKSINVLEGSVTCHPYQKIPSTIEQNGQFIMEVRSGGNIMYVVKYKLEFLYTDEMNTQYRTTAEFIGGTGKMSEAEEVSY